MTKRIGRISENVSPNVARAVEISFYGLLLGMGDLTLQMLASGDVSEWRRSLSMILVSFVGGCWSGISEYIRKRKDALPPKK